MKFLCSLILFLCFSTEGYSFEYVVEKTTGCVYTETSSSTLRAISEIESGHDSSKVNRKSRASGSYQFIPSTYRKLGYSKNDIHDPVKSTKIADEYFQKLLVINKGNKHSTLREYYGGIRGKNSKTAHRYANRVLKKKKHFENNSKWQHYLLVWNVFRLTCDLPS